MDQEYILSIWRMSRIAQNCQTPVAQEFPTIYPKVLEEMMASTMSPMYYLPSQGPLEYMDYDKRLAHHGASTVATRLSSDFLRRTSKMRPSSAGMEIFALQHEIEKIRRENHYLNCRLNVLTKAQEGIYLVLRFLLKLLKGWYRSILMEESDISWTEPSSASSYGSQSYIPSLGPRITDIPSSWDYY